MDFRKSLKTELSLVQVFALIAALLVSYLATSQAPSNSYFVPLSIVQGLLLLFTGFTFLTLNRRLLPAWFALTMGTLLYGRVSLKLQNPQLGLDALLIIVLFLSTLLSTEIAQTTSHFRSLASAIARDSVVSPVEGELERSFRNRIFGITRNVGLAFLLTLGLSVIGGFAVVPFQLGFLVAMMAIVAILGITYLATARKM